ncbi:DUF4230 domain-containing protein [Zobellia galactanivorans]|uniref:Conserved hypothetical membrane protein n=1 Tax=Zobellia galactanivorans (strain DSM 12802 / CCUG 47099 / CIP 106680 / NCIMB 13871 / Dsij) TaxID=63186 RepID=G0L2J7_ZOBGA|nr:DUF4230 domain-containing protein [Zobellia galactanivorans]MBU3024580.1 DUF4230 domain-containing protein [Zobellia galactanivorans]MDO6810835.1 DUF4230 domain-containing protein [Zobellia galactanivorans]CAZ95029.1 Conserved hypothetical membrane protein [Zobellia galactanivorans]
MKKVFVGVIVTLAVVLVFRSCADEREEKSILQENSMLIQTQIDNVSKLIVTEGHFAEVYNYKDSKMLFGPFISAEKKALVVVNADVTIAYDLNQIDFEVDEVNKILRIKSIPEPEVKINPDFEYYDVSSDYLNMFEASDYNKIKKNVKASLMKKVEASSLKTNARNRLISELQKFYILTNSMGWQLVYKDEVVDQNLSDFFLKD